MCIRDSLTAVIGVFGYMAIAENSMPGPFETVYAQNSRDKEIQLLARCVNGEARGEPYIGQVAVAAVILNRVRHPSFPDTLTGVI